MRAWLKTYGLLIAVLPIAATAFELKPERVKDEDGFTWVPPLVSRISQDPGGQSMSSSYLSDQQLQEPSNLYLKSCTDKATKNLRDALKKLNVTPNSVNYLSVAVEDDPFQTPYRARDQIRVMKPVGGDGSIRDFLVTAFASKKGGQVTCNAPSVDDIVKAYQNRSSNDPTSSLEGLDQQQQAAVKSDQAITEKLNEISADTTGNTLNQNGPFDWSKFLNHVADPGKTQTLANYLLTHGMQTQEGGLSKISDRQVKIPIAGESTPSNNSRTGGGAAGNTAAIR